MNGSDKPHEEILKGLEGLGKETLSTDPFDLPAVVSILSRIEDAVAVVSDDPMHAMLDMMAAALRAVVLDETPDVPVAMMAVGRCAEALDAYLGADEAAGDMARLEHSIEKLKAVLSSEATGEAAAADEVALSDIAARLITMNATDKAPLRELCEQIERAAESVHDDVAQPLKVSAAFIEQCVLGSTDDPDQSLASAGDFLAEAISMYETLIEQGQSVEDVVADKADDGPVQSISDEQMAADENAAAPAAAAPADTLPQGEVDGNAVLPADADMEILKEYIVESLDHIEASEAALLELESAPENTELINTVFRAFHTIKGTSGFFGLTRNQQLAHLAENLLDRARNGQVKLTGGYADLCLRSCDLLRSMVQTVEQATPGGILVMPEGLDELLVQLGDPEKHGFTEDVVPEEAMRVGDILVGKGVAQREAVEQAAGDGGEGLIGQKLVKKHVAPAGEVVKAVRQQKQQAAASGGAKSVADATVRVATDRLDAMINMVGELVIAQSMVSEDASADADNGRIERLSRNVSHAGKIIRDLQDLTMSLRMVPLKGVFHKMQRLVRDLGRKSNKTVQLLTEGEDTEIDRGMVELLNDPLLHMIRNSVDHGLESSDRRVEAGKDAMGTVWLRAYHSAGNVVIELQDDGAGLNREKIFNKAVERGLVSRDVEMSDQDVYNLIWQPGFSTAETITDVSGRGVGMDVVRRSIEEMRGRVELASEPGKGTTFTIRLPLTMAIADAMLLKVGGQRFLLPTISIEQSFRAQPADLSTVIGEGEMVMLRGDLLPIFRVHKLFNVSDAITDLQEGILIVVESEGKRCAMLVDELLGQQQVVIKSLGETFGTVFGVAGASILGDGTVGLILDAGGIIKLGSGTDTDFMAA